MPQSKAGMPYTRTEKNVTNTVSVAQSKHSGLLSYRVVCLPEPQQCEDIFRHFSPKVVRCEFVRPMSWLIVLNFPTYDASCFFGRMHLLRWCAIPRRAIGVTSPGIGLVGPEM